jgi:ketosteroid isomerase-like protein
MDTFEQAVEKYHATLMEFVKGNAEPTLEVWSQRDDVVLCNPLRPFAHGPAELAETTRAAALNFADGEYIFETVEKYVTPELGYIIEIERFKAMVGGKEGSGALRVTTILRPEDDGLARLSPTRRRDNDATGVGFDPREAIEQGAYGEPAVSVAHRVTLTNAGMRERS